MNNIDYMVLLDSSKYSMKEKNVLFIGILSTTLLDRDLFKKNIDLKEYVNIYEKLWGIEPYKDYLYDSRPMLMSRIIRDYSRIDDNMERKKCFLIHNQFMIKKLDIKNTKDIKNNKDKNLLIDMINRNIQDE